MTTIIVNTNLDDANAPLGNGFITLRDAIAMAGPTDVISFAHPMAITLDKPLFISAGHTVTIDGGNFHSLDGGSTILPGPSGLPGVTVRATNQAAFVVLAGATANVIGLVFDGSMPGLQGTAGASGAAGVVGTPGQDGLLVVNPEGPGGGIFIQPNLISDTPGGTGGAGGAGSAAETFAAGVNNFGTLTLQDVLLENFTIQGGAGGTGGVGGAGGTPGTGGPRYQLPAYFDLPFAEITPDGGRGGDGGVGGQGGAGQSVAAALYNAGTLTLIDTAFLDNAATGGVGGAGGAGGTGARGGDGEPAGSNIVDPGGNGGNGGDGGTGGRGGNGGTGYAALLNVGTLAYGSGPIASHGNDSEAGSGGAGGAGGAAGERGLGTANILSANGGPGDAGGSGASGQPGAPARDFSFGGSQAPTVSQTIVYLGLADRLQGAGPAGTQTTFHFYINELGVESTTVAAKINFQAGPGLTAVNFVGGMPSASTEVHFSGGQYAFSYTLISDGGIHGDESFTVSLVVDPSHPSSYTAGSVTSLVATLYTPPVTPAAPVLAQDTGIAGDNVTSNPTITYPAPIAGHVLLYSLDGSAYIATVPTFATNGTADGLHTVSIEEQDSAGHVSSAASLTFTLDTQAPATPAAAVLAHDTGTAGDKITSNPTITYPTPAAGGVLLYSLDGGAYTTTLPVFATNGTADGAHTVSIEEQDTAGNISGAASLTFTLDTQAPATPAAPVLAHDTGAAGDNITSDATITYPAPAAGDVLLYSLDGGAYTTAVPAFATNGTADGSHTVSIEAQDSAGNISGAASLTFTLDTQTPATPAAPALGHDTGTAGDKVTSDATITYPTTAAGDVLFYSLDGGAYTTTVPTFAANGTADGLHTVSIEAQDSAGHIGGAASLTFTLDTQAPAIPMAPRLAHDTGSSGSDNITSDAAIIYPAPAAGDVLLYSLDGGAYTTTVPVFAGNGTADGLHTVSIAARDSAGNIGAAASLAFTLDTQVPAAPATPALTAASDSGKSQTDNLTNVTTPTFAGMAEANALITLYDGAAVIGSAIADGAGNWSITATQLAEGQHGITATASDAAGHVSVASAVDTVTIDTTPPATPLIKLANDTGTSASDHLTTDPSITVVAASATYQTDGGATTAALPLFASNGASDGAHSVTVIDTDAAGNTSSATLGFTLDTQAPVANAMDVNAMAGKTIAGQLGGSDHLGLPVSYSLVADPTHGHLTFNSDGSYRYTSDSTFGGTDSFSFKVDNGVLGSNAATVTIHVDGANLIGTPGNDTFTALSGTESITGNGGTDTVIFNFKLTDAHISFVGSQVIVDTVSSHTVLNGFSIYQFNDGTVNEAASSNPLVDPLFYYSQYHDVWSSHGDVGLHYQNFGWHEGRDPNAFFDTDGYLAHNPDVKAAGLNPLQHYDQYGWKEGRDPSVDFDTKHYLAANPDVAAAHVDPLAHFLQHGQFEGRSTFADGVWG